MTARNLPALHRKVVQATSSKMLANFYQPTGHHTPEDHILLSEYPHKPLISHKIS